jgi:hypothetical protein
MKVLVKEVEKEGLEAFLGKTITLFCGVYIYTGKVVSINEISIKLEDAKIVYETGELTAKNWTDVQPLPGDWYVTIQSVESFGFLK